MAEMTMTVVDLDHEKVGAKEWLLPGSEGAAATQRQVPTEPASLRQQKRTPGNISASSAQGSPSQPENSSSKKGLGVAPHLNAPSRFPKDSDAKAAWRAGVQPSDTILLPTSFSAYKSKMMEAGREIFDIREHGHFDLFEQISRTTGAFVRTSYKDRKVGIWGDPQQVEAAKVFLLKILARCNARSNARKVHNWAKIKAFSAVSEDRLTHKEEKAIVTRTLRKAPNWDARNQLCFLWPEDELPTKEVFGKELQRLDPIRNGFRCTIYSSDECPGLIHFAGPKDRELQQLTEMLRTKWQESLATSSVRSKVYLLGISHSGQPQVTVTVQKLHGLSRPSFHRVFQQDEEGYPQDWIETLQSKNNTRLTSAIERSLRCLPFLKGGVCIRVNIGSFVLDKYRKPRDEQAGYSFEEFREMLLQEKTKGRIVPGLDLKGRNLMDRVAAASDLLEPLQSSTLSPLEANVLHTVNFEFSGDRNSSFRLEVDFEKHACMKEFEVTQVRWVRANSNGHLADTRPFLQAVMVNSEHADWQLEIRNLQIHDSSNPDSIPKPMQKFAHQVGFRPGVSNENLSMKPKRRTVYPGDAPVRRIIEKAAVQYRVKGTSYILEIARYDEYCCSDILQAKPARPGMSETATSSWGASLFRDDWDKLLADCTQPNAEKDRSAATLNAFFAPKQGAEEAGNGFKQFMKITDSIARLLSMKDFQQRPEPTTENSTGSKGAQLLGAELGTMF